MVKCLNDFIYLFYFQFHRDFTNHTDDLLCEDDRYLDDFHHDCSFHGGDHPRIQALARPEK